MPDRQGGAAPGPVLTVAVLADTHLTGDLSRLPEPAWARLRGADAIVHAGDVVTADLLDALAELAPVHAVLGNNDRGLAGRLPERLEVELGGVAVAVVHDSGARAGRAARLRRWFPEAQVAVFGHSHEPVDVVTDDGLLLFNPGSAVQRRRQPHRTMGVLRLGQGRVIDHAVVVVDPPGDT